MKVFISYSVKDSDFVDRFTADLEAAGIDTWRDKHDIPAHIGSGTSGWRRAIEDGMNDASHMIVVLSENSLASREVEAEWNHFTSYLNKPVIPVMYKDCVPPYRLNILNVYFLNRDYDTELERVIRVLGGQSGSGKASLPSNQPGDDIETWVVSKMGRGDFRTINEAINRASDGARIVVRPGLYEESITLDRPLEIVGDGPVEDIILEFSGSIDTLLSTADHAVVRGLSIRYVGGKKYAAIDINKGRLILEDCRVTSSAQAVTVYVAGKQTRPLIRRCTIHDGKSNGIIFDGAQGTVQDCKIYGHDKPQIYVENNANPTIRNCTIRDSKSNGILFAEDTSGSVIGCTIKGHSTSNRPAVAIFAGADPIIERCDITHNASDGIWAKAGAKGRVENCDLRHNRDTWRYEVGAETVRHNNKE